ncbi:MAG: zinc-ribbon domain-containing protein [Lachnospiraceae bacterium]|nr:zinc-ribbon domain-containing protein [Lachnospiraceae bacterium]
MMSWEGIKNKISDTNDLVVNKTRAFAESVRIKGTLRDMERDRDKLFCELGKLFYDDRYGRMRIKTLEKKLAELSDGDPKKDIVAKVLEIRQSEAAIADMEEERKKLIGYTKCPACGADVEPGAEFCIECGIRIVKGEAAPEAAADEEDADEAEDAAETEDDAEDTDASKEPETEEDDNTED